MSRKLESVIWSHDTGQKIPCFDRCQLTITSISKMCAVSQSFNWYKHAPAMHAASHVHHEKRAASFPISTHVCASLPVVMVLRLATLRAAGASLLIKISYLAKSLHVVK